jgi:formimidoylglutamase
MTHTHAQLGPILPAENPIRKWLPDEYDVTFADIVRGPEELDEADVALVGIPFDTNCLQRRGSRFGPSAIRGKLVNSCTFEVGLGIDIAEGVSVVDLGDVDVVHTDPRETEHRVVEVLRNVHERGVIAVALGGDHSLAFPCIKALCDAVKGPVGVLIFDAHLDVRISLHGEQNSGVTFRRMFEELDLVAPRNVAEVGINGWFNTRFYHDYTQAQGLHIYSARDVHLRGPAAIVSEALEIVGDGVEAIYCTVDVDCLDIAAAPGTCSPSPGGLSAFELLEAVYMVGANPQVRGFDVMEVAPPLDSSEATAYVGAALVTQFIGGVRSRDSHANDGEGDPSRSITGQGGSNATG